MFISVLESNGAYHSSYINEKIKHYKVIAIKYNLLVSSGSDFYGK